MTRAPRGSAWGGRALESKQQRALCRAPASSQCRREDLGPPSHWTADLGQATWPFSSARTLECLRKELSDAMVPLSPTTLSLYKNRAGLPACPEWLHEGQPLR